MIHTAEAVTAWHPDKICDQISDGIVDACLEQDPNSRVAVETMGGHGALVLTGEITTKAHVDIATVAKEIYWGLTGKEIAVFTNIVKQSSEISMGVDTGGAGDQGIMVGYACRETPNFMPYEIWLAHKLLEPYKTDGKSQVTVKDGEPVLVVMAVQGRSQKELLTWVRSQIKTADTYVNNTGSFKTGGFDADSGCTGRKIVVDAYGPRVPVGGGAFSGKDPTKVDRSAAYMARWIALKELKESGAKEALVKLAYVIGRDDPLMETVVLDGVEKDIDYDCRPLAIIEQFDLRKPIYLDTAGFGHFGRKSLPWEKV